MKLIKTIFKCLAVLLLFTSLFTFNVNAQDEVNDEETIEVITQEELIEEDTNISEDDETVDDKEIVKTEENTVDDLIDVLDINDNLDEYEDNDNLTPADQDIDNQIYDTQDISPTSGYAYAVLKDDGDLVFFRSLETYENASTGTFIDIYNNEYIGTVFAGFEDSDSVPWEESNDHIYKVYVASNQTIIPTSMNMWFFSSGLLTSFDSKGFDTSNVKDMSYLFGACHLLKTVDLSSFNTSNVIDMSYMFFGCISLTSLDLSSFKTTKLLKMSNMFAACASLETLDISSFNTSKVTDMSDLFKECAVSFIKLGNGFTNWINDAKLPEGSYRNETLNLTKTDTQLYEQYPENANAWSGWWSRGSIAYAILKSDGDFVFTRSMNTYENNTSDTVVDIDGNSYTGTVFTGFETKASTPPWNDRKADIKKVYAVNKIRPISLYIWFSHCYNLTSFDATNFDTSQVTDMTSMFMYSNKIESLDLSTFNTSKVKDMRCVFMGVSNLKDLNIKNFNTSNVTDMYELFRGCSSLKKLDLSHFDTSKVTRMSYMFKNCTSLATVNLSSFDTSRVTDMAEMFDGCSVLASVKLGPKWSNWVSDAKLPQGNWENEALSLVKTETELYSDYPSNSEAWNGLWNRESHAYAVLKEDGDLVFVRSIEKYNGTTTGTLVSIDGDSYTGIIFPGVENLVVKDSDELPWAEYIPNVKRIYAVNVIKPTSTAYWFAAHENLTSFNSENFDLSKTTSMKLMFYYCLNLTDLDLSHFDTSNVVDTSSMFSYCQSLVSLDLSNLNTSKVTNMRYMFYKCTSLTNLDLSGFDTANITKMDHLFNYSAVSSIKLGPGFTNWIDGAELPSGDWKNEELDLVKTETELYNQYPENANAWSGWWKKQSFAYAVLQDDGDFIFARSKQLFENGVSGTLNSISGGSYSGIIFSNIESTDGYYYNTPWRAYEKNIKKVYAVDPIKPLNTSCWFDNCRNLTSFNKANFDLSRVEDISSMFSNCSSLEELNLSGLDTSNANRWGNMFAYCKNLVTLDLGGLDTSKAYTYEHMFIRCEKLKNLNISSFNSSNVNTMRGMFEECKSLNNLDLSHFDTSKVNNMEEMFTLCSSLKTLDISSFNTSIVGDGKMKKMFDGLNSLYSIKLGSNFAKWIDKAYLPSGTWKNKEKDLSMSEIELYNDYPNNASAWQGTWTKAAPVSIPVLKSIFNVKNGIDVRFGHVENATSYIFIRIANGKETIVAEVNKDDIPVKYGYLNWTDTSVKSEYGKGFAYKVIAKKGLIESEPSEQLAIFRLNEPTITKLETKSNSVKVSWNKEKVHRYVLQYSADGTNWTTIETTATSRTITGLKPNTTYYFRVRGVMVQKDGTIHYSQYSTRKSVKTK